jgi:ATP-dependent DNA ligase
MNRDSPGTTVYPSRHNYATEAGGIVTPPMYAVFDCLYLRGRDLRDEPLSSRRRAVEATLGHRHMLLFAARRLAANGLRPGLM